MRTRSALTAVLVSATALTGVVTSAAPSQAAAGVIGRLDAVSITINRPACSGGRSIPQRNACVYRYNTFTVKGWALNKSTDPVQDVRLAISGSRVYHSYDSTGKFTPLIDYRGTSLRSGAHTANLARNDVKRAYKLSSNKVGYAFTYRTSGNGRYYGTVKVCIQGRDHGSSQSWRTLQCRAVKQPGY